PASFPVNAVYLWTSGPQEAVLEVSLNPKADIHIEDFKENLRAKLHERMPQVEVSFEATGIINKIMSQGSPTPIEIAVAGPRFKEDREFARKIFASIQDLPSLRDLHYDQVFEYPAIGVKIDRRQA